MTSFLFIAVALIESSGAIFRSRLNKFVEKRYHNDKLSMNVAQKTTHMVHDMDHSYDGRRHERTGKCQMPCQRESFWIPFASVMELGNIPNALRGTIRSNTGNMIDIGKCVGFCRQGQFPLYRREPVSELDFLS